MGFFDKFSSNTELTPAIALATSMIYMMASDGEIDDEELNYLAVKLYAIGDAEELMSLSQKYSKKQDLEAFQKEANEKLTEDQKFTILANLIDILLADGDADEDEQNLFFSFVEAFGISEDDIQVYIDIISVKNDLASFVE
ncbi:MAG: TerB family tellurite resistance protein [Sulfurovum sp.]|nr:MAG: TerB family tellurite resistance protein [Sulfurovum sp.]